MASLADLHRYAVTPVIFGCVYAATVTLLLLVVVLPRESMTLTVTVIVPDFVRIFEVTSIPLYVVSLIVTEQDLIFDPDAPAAVLFTLSLLFP